MRRRLNNVSAVISIPSAPSSGSPALQPHPFLAALDPVVPVLPIELEPCVPVLLPLLLVAVVCVLPVLLVLLVLFVPLVDVVDPVEPAPLELPDEVVLALAEVEPELEVDALAETVAPVELLVPLVPVLDETPLLPVEALELLAVVPFVVAGLKQIPEVTLQTS